MWLQYASKLCTFTLKWDITSMKGLSWQWAWSEVEKLLKLENSITDQWCFQRKISKDKSVRINRETCIKIDLRAQNAELSEMAGEPNRKNKDFLSLPGGSSASETVRIQPIKSHNSSPQSPRDTLLSIVFLISLYFFKRVIFSLLGRLACGSPWWQTLNGNSLLIWDKHIFVGAIPDSLF